MALSDLSERGDDARVDGEWRPLALTGLDAQRDSWFVLIVLGTLLLAALGVLCAGAAWMHHHEWVKHHPAWAYDDYRHGYAAGLGVPATLKSRPCQRAEAREYPDSVRREARREPRSQVGVEVIMFDLGCLDGTRRLPPDLTGRAMEATSNASDD
jgi:hypothetical protein